jgi:hypothetical protein
MTSTISEGDLEAYLAGEKRPDVERALRTSPELQRELHELRQLNDRLLQGWGGIEHPDPQDLVDVVAGQATEQQKLVVAAYVRRSARGRRELELLQKEARLADANFPHFVAQLVTTLDDIRFSAPQLLGVRSATRGTAKAEAKIERVYQVAELQMEVKLQIMPPTQGERWQIIGVLTQGDEAKEAITGAQVVLQGKRGRPHRSTTDTIGFFAFRGLKQGTYQMNVYVTEGSFAVDDIDLP